MGWWFHKDKPVEKSFDFLNSVINQIESSIVCLDSDYHVLYMNDKMRRLLKIEVDDDRAIDFFKYIPADEKKQYEYILKNIRFSKSGTFTLKLKINNIVSLYECLGKFEKSENMNFFILALLPPARYHKNTQQLVNAQKFEILGRLTSGFAHDFNNLLAAAIGYITLLKQPDRSAEKVEIYLEKLDNVLSEGANSLRKILMFSRSEMEELKPIQLNEFIPELLHFIDKLIRPNIKIDLKLNESDVIVKSNPVKLEQALINLIINARDAIEGPGKISIKTDRIVFEEMEESFTPPLEPGNYVTIHIKDTGKGIPEEVIEKIFEPYFSTKKDSGGSGLGMFIVFETMQSFKGGIKLLSQVGVGTECIVALPQTVMRRRQTPKEKIEPLYPTKIKLLVIEDEAEVSEILVEMLKSMNYKPYIRRTAKSALKFLAEKTPDIIIMDFGLPDMEGKELFRQLYSSHDIPILISTGYTKKELLEVIPDLDPELILSKPFHLDRLKASINWALSKTK